MRLTLFVSFRLNHQISVRDCNNYNYLEWGVSKSNGGGLKVNYDINININVNINEKR